MKEILKIKNISKDYGIKGFKTNVLKNISLTVNEGDFISIIMITHDPLTASYSNEVYMINDGNIKCKLNKGNSRKEFYGKIMDMLASMGGEM